MSKPGLELLMGLLHVPGSIKPGSHNSKTTLAQEMPSPHQYDEGSTLSEPQHTWGGAHGKKGWDVL
jgi:hypothetical protein